MLNKYRRKFHFNIKRFFLIPFFLFFTPNFANAVEFPEKPSKQASISLLSINYNDLSHSFFSKSCLRLYDKENDFDQVVDFAHFDDFDDELFGLKFFLKSKKARILVRPFFTYFLEQNERTNVSLTEFKLDLSPEEIEYIFNFLATMYKALPNYYYDFDILSDNSETHISKILHDCYRMVGDNEATERYSFSEITKHNLSYKKINDSYLILSENEKTDFSEEESQNLNSTTTNEPSLIIILLCISGFFFLLTLYQTIAYFIKKICLNSVFKTVQIIDFLILFIAGISGTIILFQDIFSEQTLLRNNYQFLFLNPLHLITAFTLFNSVKNKKLNIYYWSISSALSMIYILIISIQEKQIPILTLLIALPIFLRTIYYTFMSVDMLNKSKIDQKQA